jgi:hypothetical protein
MRVSRAIKFAPEFFAMMESSTCSLLITTRTRGIPKGSLCFQRLGWEMFEQLQQAGFHNVWALRYYSPDYGYLGSEQLQFLAQK